MPGKTPFDERTDTMVRSLEDAFFAKADDRLTSRQRQLRARAASLESLAQVSGIRESEVLQRLLDAGIRPHMMAALALVPLVEVAWADDDADDDERAAVLKAAESGGLTPGSAEHECLVRWLSHRPEPDLSETWSQFVYALCSRFTPPERLALRQALLGKARGIAETSGGVFGIGRFSSAEKKALLRLEECFRCE